MPRESGSPDDIAIVAVEGRFPGAPDTDAYWALIRDGRCAVADIDAAALRRAGVAPEIFERADYVRKTMPLDGFDQFAADFFGYSHRQAAEIDPQQRLFLEACWTALERSGCDPRRFPGAIGVFAGAGPNRYALSRLNQLLQKRDWTQWTQATIDSEKDFLATRVSYKLDLTGPSLTVQTACSSSLVAVHLACQSLRQRDCDLALAGGVNIVVPQGLGFRHAEGGIASRDGQCRAFDRAATGTIAGSGLGIVALKRHEDALRDGSAVLALVKGSAINNDGARKAGYTAPSLDGQSDVIELALNGIDPATIEMIEAHGTGTALGDAVELDSLQSFFGTARCALGSVKANIGHLDAASGVAGLIKAVLCLKHRQIPPQINFSVPNEHLRIDGRSLYINRRLQSWGAARHPRRAAISSFGMGGTNAHVVLQEAVEVPREATDPSDQLFVLSAKTMVELDRLRHALADHLGEDAGLRLDDVAYTLLSGRAVLEYRMCAIARDRRSLMEALRGPRPALVQSQKSRLPVLLVFPAVLGPEDGASAGLLHTDPDFRVRMRSAAAAIQRRSGIDLLGATEDGGHVPESKRHSVASCLLASFILAGLLRDMGIEKPMVIGDGTGHAVAAAFTSDAESSFLDWLADFLVESDTSGAPLPWKAASTGAGMPSLPTAGIALVFGTAIFKGSVFPSGQTLPPGWTCHDVWGTLGNGGRTALLGLLRELWLSGADLTPQRQTLLGKPRLLALATYPFDRRRYWIDELADPVSPRADISRPGIVDAPGRAAGLTFHVPSWRPAPGADPRLPVGSWVVFGGADGIEEEALENMRQHGARVVCVEPGESVRKRSALAYQMRAEVRDDYVSLWQGISEDGGAPDFIVLGTWLAESATNDAAPAHVFLSLLYLVQSFVDVFGPGHHPTILVATRGVYAGPGVGVSHAGPSVLAGLLKVITQELSMPTKLVDLPPRGDPWSTRQDGAFHDADLFTEAKGCTGAQVVAYRGARRFVHDYQLLDPQDEMPGGLRRDRTFLITGGLGLIGLALAEDLVRRHAARLLLITRGPFPDRAAWTSWLNANDKADSVSQKIRRLLDIESAGGQIVVKVADVARQAELAEAVHIGERVLGRINGVFHLAADTRHRSIRLPILLMEPDDFAAQARPKIDGFNALDHVLADHDLDVAVTFSSNASVLGGYGFAAYAAVNAYLDHAVVALPRSSRIRWRSINWDGWHNAAEDPQNPLSMPIGQGLAALQTVLGMDCVPQVVVALGDLSARLRTWLGRDVGRNPPAADKPAVDKSVSGASASWSELEVCVWEIWRDVLGNNGIDLDQGFDDLGGDSLIAMRIVERLGDAIGFEVPLEVFLGRNITITLLCGEVGRIARHAMIEKDRLPV